MISNRKKVLVVLGMHRSGTSVMTRGLKALGVDLGGRLMPPVAGNNDKGFWEDLDINSLNDRILAVLGRHWHSLPPVREDEFQARSVLDFRLEAIALLRDRVENCQVFGMKDPRVSRLLPFWLDVFNHLNLEPGFLIACRNPLSVSRSLAKRDGFLPQKSYCLWLEHMLQSLRYSSGYSRLVVDYDLFMQSPATQLGRVASRFDLPFDVDSPDFAEFDGAFVDVKLRRNLFAREDLDWDSSVPYGVTALYDSLKSLAMDAKDFSDSDVERIFQQLWARMDENRVMLDFMGQVDDALLCLKERDAEILRFREVVGEQSAEIIRLNEAVGEQSAEIIRLNEAVEEQSAEIIRLNEAVEERDREIATLSSTLLEIYNSRGWRLLAPLRWYGRWRGFVARAWQAFPQARARAGGFWPLLRFMLGVLRRDGWVGVKSLFKKHVAHLPQSSGILAATGTDSSEQDESSARTEILFVSHEASRTGAPIFLLNLIDFIKKELGVRSVIVLRRGGELEGEFQKRGDTFVLGDENVIDPVLYQALKGRPIRLVYSNTITNGSVHKRLKSLGAPVVCHVHELAFSVERYFGEDAVRTVLENTDFFLAGSGAVKKFLVDEKKIAADRVALAYPFIDVSHNLREASASHISLGLPPEALVVGACGMIGWRKGTDVFVQVAKKVLEQVSLPVVFVWVGGPLSHGEYLHVRHDVEQMGLSDKVHFLGAVEDHLQYFQLFDIFLLPSREDPFPLVVMDAASLGIPVVCFDQAGGAPELIEHDAGRVTPYLDIDAMAATVRELVEDDALRVRQGACGRVKVQERHDIAVGGGKIAHLIRPLLDFNDEEKS